ncbi:hypothetical protein GCM10011584_09930 [Nocardioides phosphati]|uniref:Uncharacterized protein n=1 Tax=Nocardioides phosphati TaxID=1867775 RepID=A0ABQ2N730_9ACTN|nr:hypothetical protein GCM10011584_09930 [Nocardioides phosphati]
MEGDDDRQPARRAVRTADPPLRTAEDAAREVTSVAVGAGHDRALDERTCTRDDSRARHPAQQQPASCESHARTLAPTPGS